MGNIGLCTFPDDDKDYCKYFEVPKGWLLDVWEKWSNDKQYIDLDEFLDNYVWDETWFIYNLAKDNGVLIMEKEEA